MHCVAAPDAKAKKIQLLKAAGVSLEGVGARGRNPL